MGGGGDATVAAPALDADGFYWSPLEEPHVSRRKAILKKYPQVNKLMGPEPRTKWIVLVLVAVQVSLSVLLREASWPVYVLLTYVVGATITHALFLAIHELAHNLGAKRPEANRLIAMVANLPIVAPYCVTFKQYHMEHHKAQGVEGMDTDIPLAREAWLFAGPLGKAVWVASLISFYAVRPMFVKVQTPNAMHALNLCAQLAFDYALVSTFGWASLRYLVYCVLLAGSIHPTAGHFISEHYVFKKGQETYSYYGPLNALTFNVGYHNEHHDFPFVAWSRLPALRALAPEFYEPLATHESWCQTIWDFIFREDVTLTSRIKRAGAGKAD